jgi:hypothetical protein
VAKLGEQFLALCISSPDGCKVFGKSRPLINFGPDLLEYRQVTVEVRGQKAEVKGQKSEEAKPMKESLISATFLSSFRYRCRD